MSPGWFEDREPSTAKRIALAPLSLAALAYGAGARLHRQTWARGWRRPTRLGCRVISVGNPVVGGSGKTPFAAWLARGLRERGHRVVLASRGYGRSEGDPVEVVSDGVHVLSSAARAGDEPLVLAAHAPGVPVLVGSDRARVGQRALAAFGAQILVLDDGFQHHRLMRDLDLVVLDGRGGLGNRRVLPRGPLREPLQALARADALGVIDGPLGAADEQALAEHAPTARRFEAGRRPATLRPLAGGPAARPGTLAGREVGLVCGIARPASLCRSVEALGARVIAMRAFPDHHRFRERDLRGLEDEAAEWVTTEKDAVKLLPDWVGKARVFVLGIEIAVEAGAELLDWVEGRLRGRPLGRDPGLR